MYKRFGLNGFAVLCLLAGGSVHAEQAPGFFVGAGVGQAKVKFDQGPYDESDTGFKVFGGYNVNNYFSAELAYVDGGEGNREAVETPPAVIGPPIKVTFKVGFTGVNFSLVGRVPLTDAVAVFGKLGYASYDMKSTYSGSYFTHGYEDKSSDKDLSYGGGVAFSFGKFDLRAEYETISINAGDFNMLSLSGVYRF